ncbi:hypothetical protein KA996_11315, partial [bacterium]|nr:hypothetical protein [bacterium]
MKRVFISTCLILLCVFINDADSQYSKIGVAVFPFKGPDKQTSENISSDLNSVLFKSKFINVLDRANIDAMMDEAALGQLGVADPSTMVEVGKVHGMQVMITGFYDKNRIVANATHMETLKVISSA